MITHSVSAKVGIWAQALGLHWAFNYAKINFLLSLYPDNYHLRLFDLKLVTFTPDFPRSLSITKF